MSRRFGRNQKRKMREALASTTAALEWDRSRANYYAGELYRAEQQIERIKRWLGANHPAFPAGKYDPGYKPQPEDLFRLRGPEGVPMTATVMRFGTPRRDEHHHQVHFMLYAGAERVGYALSDDALRSTSIPRDELAWAMTNELVNLLLDVMNKEPRP